jgi:hypothetical protein
MRKATKATVSTFGALAGLVGIEHGIGETLQGNIVPEGIVILSWPESAFFSVLAGEPAMTIVPNLLITGILAILFSLLFIAWAILFVQRKNGGLVLILLAIVMLLFGAGFGPPLLGIIVGIAGTRIHAPLTWWRSHLSGSRHLLGKLWPWFLGGSLIAWLLLFPGLNILWYFFGIDSPSLTSITILLAFGSLLLTIFSGFAHDIGRQSHVVS